MRAMGYIEDNLVPGERIVLRGKPHWAIFVVDSMGPLTGAVIMVVAAILLSSVGYLFALLAMICFLIALAQCLRAGIYILTTEFGLTDRRIIAKTGLIERHSLEIVLPKVESIRVTQPLMGRILDYGTVVVRGTGGTRERFTFISHPQLLRDRVNASLGGA
jgi:uncharacterized membrane protein YdbT with pleckstrin-like domain